MKAAGSIDDGQLIRIEPLSKKRMFVEERSIETGRDGGSLVLFNDVETGQSGLEG